MGYREWATTEHMSGWHSGKRIHLPMQEMLEIQVQCLSWEDSLEEEMATQSSILAWRIPRTEGYSPNSYKGSDMTEAR